MNATRTTFLPKLECHIRWTIRADYESILQIERSAFPQFPWTIDDFTRVLRQRNCIGLTAEVRIANNLKIAGFMVIENHTKHITLLNLAVDSRYTRRGIGTALINNLKGRLTNGQHQRRSIGGEVRESNLDALNFLKSQGFRSAGLLKKYYVEAGMFGEDAIVMRYRIPASRVS